MVQSVSPKQAQELMARGELDVVDVREPREWSTGHVAGARLVPLDRVRRNPSAALPRDGVIFICAAGVRSETAARLALANGFTNVYNLVGGTRGWVRAGLPLVKDAVSLSSSSELAAAAP